LVVTEHLPNAESVSPPAAHAADNSLNLELLELDELRPVSLEFGPGLHVIHSRDGIGVRELFHVLAGLIPPRRGRVTLRGLSPYKEPKLRAHLGTRLPEERLPPATTLRHSLQRLNLDPARLEAVLTLAHTLDAGLVATVSVARLAPSEHATVALALALTTPQPWALILHCPLKHLRPQAQIEVQESLLRLSSEIPVVVVTRSLAQAERLGAASHELIAGFCRHREAQRSGWAELHVQGLGLRSLVAELSRLPAIRNLRWTAERQGQETIELETSDSAATSLMIARSSRETGTRIFSLRSHTVPK
jgi:ABC-type cobalamin/Fe3+-siderophores transport system ATPase subunit